MPRFSIVTINYNNYSGLVDTSNSVKNLLDQNVEWIVIDGLSTDGSAEYIKKQTNIDKYLIEKDRGIYDAMNKAIELVTGDLVIFMNSGDLFHPDFSFTRIQEKIGILDPKKLIIYGSTLRKVGKIYYFDEINDSNMNWWETNTPCHQSIFIPHVFLKETKFDTKLKIYADHVNMYSAFKKIENHIKLNNIISIYEVGGVSSIGGKNMKQLRRIVNELVYVTTNNKNLPYMKKVRLKIKLYLKLYIKFLLIKIVGYKAYYSFAFSLKSIKSSNEK